MSQLQEEIIVLFHAALIGRTDVVQNAITSIRTNGKLSDKEVASVISTGRAEDKATPLHIAAHYGHTDVIRSLLNAGADLSFAPVVGEYANRRPYELASDATKETFHVYMFEQIAMNNDEAIQRLIDGGLPVDHRDDSPAADSTLHWAASFGGVKVATVLLLNGCSVNICNEDGQTPLHLACKGKHAAVIELLLDEGAAVDVADKAGQFPQDLLSIEASAALEAMLMYPPIPSMRLHEAYEKAKEEKAAREQLLLQQRLQQVQALEAPRNDGKSPREPQDADENDAGLGEAAPGSDEKELLLIFWPPVKRQQRVKNSSPLELRNSANLLISVASSEIDMIPLLTWSGLMDVMDSFGFQVQIKRSSAGARIRLCIDKYICPVGNSYELKVGTEQIFLTGADSAGLLYGVYTLIQMLKLHSETHIDHAGVLHLRVPAVTISDRPDVAQRAVLWSYRQHARTCSSRMQEQVELLSRLRLNTLFLVIDPVDSKHLSHVDHAASHHKTLEFSSNEATSTKVYSLDEKCRRHCVDLVPTLVIQSIHQRLPQDVLKNFSHKMISLVFAFDKQSIAAELAADSAAAGGGAAAGGAEVDATAAARAACITTCELVIKDAHLAGCTTLSIACSEWTRQTADPVSMAINAGLSATEKDFALMYPSSLFTKPLLCVQDYVQSISTYSRKVEENCAALSVFPAFMDRDFMYPALLLKFYCFIFAGFAWNRVSLLDMLGDPASGDFNANIVREVLYLLVFPAKVETPQVAFQVMMDLITGTTYASELAAGDTTPADGQGSNGKSASQLERTGSEISLLAGAENAPSPFQGVPAAVGARQNLARAEKLLWSLLTSRDSMSSACVPSKSEAAALLRVYRRILQAAQWKPDTLANKQIAKSGLLSFMAGGSGANFSGDIDESAHDALAHSGVDMTHGMVLEVEEVFCTLNLLSALCKVLVLAHKTHEKKHAGSAGAEDGESHLTFEALFESVSVGTKSDFANSILECLSSCTYLWKRRFEGSLLMTFKTENLLLHKPKVVADGVSSSQRVDASSTIKEANRRFLLQETPLVPASAVFRLVTRSIPLPKSVHEFIQRLFVR